MIVAGFSKDPFARSVTARCVTARLFFGPASIMSTGMFRNPAMPAKALSIGAGSDWSSILPCIICSMFHV